jgi:hypothetical protein
MVTKAKGRGVITTQKPLIEADERTPFSLCSHGANDALHYVWT